VELCDLRCADLYVSNGTCTPCAPRSVHHLLKWIPNQVQRCGDCAQVLHGLAYLHEQGVVHRDIKGANILTGNEVCH